MQDTTASKCWPPNPSRATAIGSLRSTVRTIVPSGSGDRLACFGNLGWGVGQYPWVLVDSARIHDAAAPHATLWALVVVVGLAAVLVLPPLAYLLTTTQRGWWVHRDAAELSGHGGLDDRAAR